MLDAICIDDVWHYVPNGVPLDVQHAHGNLNPGIIRPRCFELTGRATRVGWWAQATNDERCPKCRDLLLREPMQFSHVDAWHGQHRGITWEIKRWDRWDGFGDYKRHVDAWAFYLWLREEAFTPDAWAQTLNERSELIQEINWHGDCTFYKHHTTRDGSIAVEAGCDYGHHFDQEHDYELGEIIFDVRQAIASLHNLTTVLVGCPWLGVCVPESEGAYARDGTFYTLEGLHKWRAERRAERKREAES